MNYISNINLKILHLTTMNRWLYKYFNKIKEKLSKLLVFMNVAGFEQKSAQVI